ncbi:hypothetical protein D3C73_1453550 [compost metagenome]
MHEGRPDHLPVEVGEHESELRMLQDGINLADPVASLLGIGRRDDRFQERSPIRRMGSVFGIWFGQRGITPGFLHPKLKRRLVGGEAYGSGSVGAADAGLAYFQPIGAFDFSGVDQA